MQDWYYAPWQYELRDVVPEIIGLGREVGTPTPILIGAAATVGFLAYTPLLQPSPPAKTSTPYVLPPIALGRPGGGMVV